VLQWSRVFQQESRSIAIVTDITSCTKKEASVCMEREVTAHRFRKCYAKNQSAARLSLRIDACVFANTEIVRSI
jgi:hypothetical protein